MKSALLVKHGKPLELAILEPEPLSYGQVLVRVLASGICGAQIQEIDGTKQGGPLPHPLGHEACVEVVEVGPAVRQVKIGDRCVAHWRKGDGIESDFPRYRYNGQVITSGKITTFSDYSVCSENRLTPVPKDTPIELCALLGCGLSTALGTIEQEAKLLIGESVLIIGCGGLGLNLILAAKMRAASLVVGMDIRHDKIKAVNSLGGIYAMADRPMDWHLFDVVIDTTGNPEAIEKGMSRLAPSGRFIMVGQPKGDMTISGAIHLFEGEGKTIKATQGGMFRPHIDIPRYIRLHQVGMLNIDGIVTHRVKLNDINKGIDFVRNGEAGRVLIEMP